MDVCTKNSSTKRIYFKIDVVNQSQLLKTKDKNILINKNKCYKDMNGRSINLYTELVSYKAYRVQVKRKKQYLMVKIIYVKDTIKWRFNLLSRFT